MSTPSELNETMSDLEIGPRELGIAALIVGLMLFSFWIGYNIGLDIGQDIFR